MPRQAKNYRFQPAEMMRNHIKGSVETLTLTVSVRPSASRNVKRTVLLKERDIEAIQLVCLTRSIGPSLPTLKAVRRNM